MSELEELEKIMKYLVSYADRLDQASADLQDKEFEYRDKHEKMSKLWDKIMTAKNYIWEVSEELKSQFTTKDESE